MITISIQDLHEKTEEWVRRAAVEGEVALTDNGHLVAKIVPQRKEPDVSEVPYFARRQMSPAFRALDESGALSGGTDCTQIISEDRENRC